MTMSCTKRPVLAVPSSVKMLARYFATVKAQQPALPRYDAVVAGGGAAGIATIGALLHYSPQSRIAWIDGQFKGGRISNRYRDVSSNTKVKLFVDYAKAWKPFEEIIASTPGPNAITALTELDQNKGCRLGYAADLLQMLTAGIEGRGNVDTYLGGLTAAVRVDDRWRIEISTTDETEAASALRQKFVETTRMVLCTGASPSSIDLPTLRPLSLHLDIALDRQKLCDHLLPQQDVTVGVIGSSHSAIVILMNLYELAKSKQIKNFRIKWFVRSALTYAEEMDGWILRDNTGLKGASADFAREHLEPGKLEASPVGKYLTKVQCHNASDVGMKPELESCNYIVQAIGLQRKRLPRIRVETNTSSASKKKPLNIHHVLGKPPAQVYDTHTGNILDHLQKPVPQVYGAGIAFPKQVTDPQGNTEYAVGMWKFVKHLKEVVPLWLADDKK